MNRRQYLQLLSVGLASAAGCTLPWRTTDEPVSPGSVEFRNTTSERAELQLQAWRIDGDGTATVTSTAAPDITVSLTADADSTAVESAVFPEGDWRLHARTGSHETTAVHSIRDLASVSVVLYPDRLRILLSGNNG